ncbi:MAG: beta strand repeat-containing protein [Gemmatimonas sp.]
MQGLKPLSRRVMGARTASKIQRLSQTAMALMFGVVAACSSDSNGPVQSDNKTISLALSSTAVTASNATAGALTANITRGGGFTGDVALAAEGLPTGVTATFNPSTLSSSATSSAITLSVGAGAVAGNSTVTIRATGSGVDTKTQTFTLTVSVPSITLTAGATTVSVPQGQTGTVALTLERLGGFAGAVSVAAEGLPANVSAAFTPQNFAAGVTASTLTFTVGSGAATATTPITIRATGTGVAEKTVTVQLTVTSAATPDFSLTASPAAVNVAQGANVTSTITLARTGGFTGNVTFTTSALPTGVTAAFNPNPATANTTVLTFTAAAGATPGTYNITVTGSATGQTARTVTVALTVNAPAGITMQLTPTAATVTAGANTQSNVVLTRNGGLTGDIALTAENAPTGVTVTFAPATVLAANTTSTATFATTGAVVAGIYTINVKATAGAVSTTQAFTLTVNAAQGYTVAFATNTATIAAGGSGSLTANITRTGGFAGTINFAVSGLPAGITATPNPAAVTGNSTQLNVTVAGGTAAGTYNGTLTSTATGTPGTTTPFSITVTGGGGGGGGNIQWQFCSASRVPLFFAYRDGSTGSWTRVTPTGNTFEFSINQAVGGVAYVLPSNSGYATTVFLQTKAELSAQAAGECATFPAGSKTVNGSVTGLASPADQFSVSLGGSTASGNGNNPFTLNNVANGSRDLLAARTAINMMTFSFDVDRVAIRRGINPADGSTLTPINFAGAESSAPAAADLTITGINGATTIANVSFQTANGSSLNFFSLPSTAATRTMRGVQTSQLIAGDLHALLVSAVSGTTVSSTRGVYTYFREIAARTVDLGAELTAPTITFSTSTVFRPKATGTFQSDFQTAFGGTFYQTNDRSVTVTSSKGYYGAGTQYELEVPDLAPLAGFQATWGLTPGSNTNWSVSASGIPAAAPTDGTVYRLAARTGVISGS